MADVERLVKEHVLYVRLNRPERKNAFTLDMVDTLAGMLADARADDEIRVVVLSGAGDAFCSGVDLSVLDGDDGTKSPLLYKRILTDRIHRVVFAVEELDKPFIAAVNGAAVGAGMDFALMADIRIASRSARFSEGYIRAGIVPGAGGCYFLPRIVGRAKALELLFTGEFVDATEAHTLGMVNRVVDDAELEAATDALAQRIASASPTAASMIKRATYQSERSDLRTSLDLVSSHMGVLVSTNDANEAISAMRERRPAVFTGT